MKTNRKGFVPGLVLSSVLKILVHNKFLSIILFGTVILGSILQLIPPQLLKQIVDGHITTGIGAGIWKLAFLYLTVVIFTGITDLLRELCTSFVGQRILSEIRLKMAQRMSKFPISYFASKPVGEIMSRVTSDVDAVGTMFSQGLIGMVADLFKMLGILVSLYIFSPLLGLYATLLLPLIYLICHVFKRRVYAAQMAVRKTVGGINAFIQELFTGIRTIKVFGMECKISSDFQPILNNNVKAVHQTNFFDSIFPVIMQILRALTIVIGIIIAAPAGFASLGITAGSIAAAVDLISRLFAPVEALATEYQTIQQAIAGLRRIEEFSNEPIEDRRYDESLLSFHADNILKPVVSISNVTFSYQDGKPILKGISLEVSSGSKIALVGRTGAGKSTLLNLIAGLNLPLSGSINVAGIDPYHMHPSLRRRTIGIVSQHNFDTECSVYESITLGDKNITIESVQYAAKLVGIHTDIILLNKGYDTIIGEGTTSLSNGQQQLLALARAVVCDPPVLLLDEVTSGLDAITESRVFAALRDISKGRTIITISHRISGIVDADTVYILDSGIIIQSGSPDELAKRDGWYSIYKKLEELNWRI